MRYKKRKWKNFLLVFLIFVCVYFYSFAYSALSTTVVVTGSAYARVEKDIRITDFKLNSSYENAISGYEEFNANMIKTNITLPKSTSYIIYKVDVTNYGSVNMALSSVTGLPSNLKYEFTNYTVKDKLCDSSGSCTLGAKKELYLKISYNSYNSSNTSFDINLTFNFQGILNINYVGITNNGYPTTMVSGETLSITFKTPIPTQVIPYVNGERYDGSFSYDGRTLTVYGLTQDVTLMYLEKTYLMNLNNTSAFKSSQYINDIETVSIVDYVDTNANDIATFDLSKNQDGSITGWIDSNYNLYIGSDWPMYADNLEGAFNGMLNVTRMDLREIDTSQNISLENTFLDCQNVVEIDISTWDTSNVKTMEGLFYNCYDLYDIDVSNFNTSKVISMASIFDGCKSLEYLDLANFDTSKVNNMQYMFYNCYSLMQIVVSYGWNTSSVTLSSSMFYNCQNLPNFYSGSMTDVSMAYSYAYGGYMSSLSEFCVGNYDLWGIVGSTWEEFIYSKYNIYGFVMDPYGMVSLDDTYGYAFMSYDFNYGYYRFAYNDDELNFNACYEIQYIADNVG